MKDFVLYPYEYPGASFNPKAHAEARLEIAGKKRNFVLKMHEGILYFKEPARAPIFAIPEILDDRLATDSIGLISRWQREVSAGNYGVFIAKRDFFTGLPVRGNFLILVRADGQGWMREHFDADWFDLPDWEKPLHFDLWEDKALEAQVAAIWPAVKASLLQRTVEPEVRQAEAPRWLGGSEAEFFSLVTAAIQHFLSTDFEGGSLLSLTVKSHSAFAKGEFEASWLKAARSHPEFDAFWTALEREFHFVGVNWTQGGEKNDKYPRPRSESIFQEGLATWGENWRGNWAPQRGRLVLQIVRVATANEAETATLQRFLRDRPGGR